MNKLLEVKEFDIITGNPNFKNDEKYKYLDTVAFENLIEFIHQFTGNEEVADVLVEAGIKGILSFSPVHLTVPKDVVVQYVDLTSELQTLLYFMRKNT